MTRTSSAKRPARESRRRINKTSRQDVPLYKAPYLPPFNKISSTIGWSQTHIQSMNSRPFTFAVVTSRTYAIAKFDASRLAKLDRMLNVRFGEINSPSDFWLYIENNVKLQNLMTKMQSFFSLSSNRIVIPERKLCKNFHCVAMLNEQYLRAKIINITIGKFIQVLFIDCGALNVITSDKVWYLPQRFANIQCQSAPAYLANIYASTPNRQWCLKSSNLFYDLINNDQTYIKIMRITNRNQKLEVLVRSQIDNQTFFVNDYLVLAGYAFYTKNISNSNHLIINDGSNKNTPEDVHARTLSSSSDANKFDAKCRRDVEGVIVSMYDPNRIEALDPVYFPDCCRDYVSGRPY